MTVLRGDDGPATPAKVPAKPGLKGVDSSSVRLRRGPLLRRAGDQPWLRRGPLLLAPPRTVCNAK